MTATDLIEQRIKEEARRYAVMSYIPVHYRATLNHGRLKLIPLIDPQRMDELVRRHAFLEGLRDAWIEVRYAERLAAHSLRMSEVTVQDIAYIDNVIRETKEDALALLELWTA